jgi:cellulose synthase/poly-beta-1,6-N-acetylglucosamine synthase-like glycosyltransferase
MIEQVFVSILVAVRNEEDNILDLLKSIEKLNYSLDKIEILIGNDASTDKTASIIEQFIENKPQFRLIEIHENLPNLKGKTNVLATLAKTAKGDYFFITDADIVLPNNWIESMLKDANQAGIITGVTVVEGSDLFAKCQAIEWLVALKIIHFLAKFKIPITSMGNNMAIKKSAYWATGGYEKIGFSIVEDYAIFKAIVDKNFDFVQHFNDDILAKTKPPIDFKQYFHQRKRWMTGAFESGTPLLIPAILQAFLLPILLVLFSMNPSTACIVWGLFFTINSILAIRAILKVKQYDLIKYVIPFHFYSLIFLFLQIIFYFIPTKIIWKGRAF